MKRIIFLSIMVLLIISSVFAFGQKEDKGMETITGIPAVYGTEPHTYVCIDTETGKVFYVHPDNQKGVQELDRYNYIFTVEFIEGPPVSLEASFHKDGTVRVLSWKKKS